jgi:hypothetical protein
MLPGVQGYKKEENEKGEKKEEKKEEDSRSRLTVVFFLNLVFFSSFPLFL